MGLFDEIQQQRFIEEDQALEQAWPAAAATQPGPTPEAGLPLSGEARGVPAMRAPARAEADWPNVVLRLDQLVAERLLAARDRSGVAITDVVLDAFDRCWLQLNQIAPPLWASPLPPPTKLLPHRGATRKVHLHLTPAQRQQLEAAADRTAAASLTDLVERVLRHNFELAVVVADCFIWATFAFEYVAGLVLLPGHPWIGVGRAAGPAQRHAAVPPTSGEDALVPRAWWE